VILDPFMGAGSTIAAAKAVGLKSVGIEIDREYFAMAVKAIPELAALEVSEVGSNGPSARLRRNRQALARTDD
jgi:site-specific DNA-methyltransferase (adenine-specific)